MSFNVLVVDDSAVVRAMIIRTLRTSGLPLSEVHESADGRAALDVLDAHWIDIALVDLNMPGMSGEELIEQVRANPATADLAILVVSGEDGAARIAQIRERGAAFLQKPFTVQTLREEIRRLTAAPSGAHAAAATGPV
jgi:two-component system chemotaxis response regulator CheY